MTSFTSNINLSTTPYSETETKDSETYLKAKSKDWTLKDVYLMKVSDGWRLLIWKTTPSWWFSRDKSYPLWDHDLITWKQINDILKKYQNVK